MHPQTKLLLLFAIFVLFVAISSKSSHKQSPKKAESTHKSSNSHFFRQMKNHFKDSTVKTWYGPFQLVSDVTYYLYLDTKSNATTEYSEVMVNNQSSAGTQTWFFHKLGDGNFSVYNKGSQQYLTLTPDLTKFVIAPYNGSDYQRFYLRSFWNGYTINCQIALGYYNYVTVSKNGTVKSLHFNGNPKTQFFQLVGIDKLDLA